MAETQRRPVPRVATSELDLIVSFLDFQREVMVIKCEGLDDDQLRRPLVDSGTNLLGLIAHLTTSEHYWFAYTLAGEPQRRDMGFEMTVPVEVSTASVLADYADACRHSNEIVRRLGDPAALTAVTIDSEHLPLRWVAAHMTAETARHAGHADILREQLDGTTGR